MPMLYLTQGLSHRNLKCKKFLLMYQDYTAIALLLFTAVPLVAVAVTAFFYVKNNDRKTPLKREDFYR